MLRFILRRLLSAAPGPVRHHLRLHAGAAAAGRPVPAALQRARHAAAVRRIQPALRARSAASRSVRRVYIGDWPPETSGRFDPARPHRHRAPRRAPAGHDRADALALLFAMIVGIPLGISPRAPQHRRRCGHHGRRQHRRLDAGLLARPAARLPLRRSCSDTPLALPPSGLLSSGRAAPSTWRRVGRRGARRLPARCPGLRLEHDDLQLADQRPVGGSRRRPPASDPAGDRAGHDPDGDHRPHDALEHARRPRPGLHPHRARQGASRAARDTTATRSAMPAAGRDGRRPVARRAPVRRGADRDDLPAARASARRCSTRSAAATTSSSGIHPRHRHRST